MGSSGSSHEMDNKPASAQDTARIETTAIEQPVTVIASKMVKPNAVVDETIENTGTETALHPSTISTIPNQLTPPPAAVEGEVAPEIADATATTSKTSEELLLEASKEDVAMLASSMSAKHPSPVDVTQSVQISPSSDTAESEPLTSVASPVAEPLDTPANETPSTPVDKGTSNDTVPNPAVVTESLDPVAGDEGAKKRKGTGGPGGRHTKKRKGTQVEAATGAATSKRVTRANSKAQAEGNQ
ncbi:hypothetical protein PQX77_021561 [Marasmius sp. AFHP31]|nr:hypothetical protein PQX77_021561 [Marasmius sp. AFHP31]